MVNKVVFSKQSDEWETPLDLFEKLNNIYNFNLDPCSTHKNAKCLNHYTKDQDGLIQNWTGHTVFCNPPYSNIKEWVKKATESKCFTVMLIPARTDTKWFHEYIYNKPNVKIEFLKGRLKFSNSKNSAPFPSMLVYFNTVQV